MALTLDGILCELLTIICTSDSKMKTIEAICRLELKSDGQADKLHTIKLKRLIRRGRLPELRLTYTAPNQASLVIPFEMRHNLTIDLSSCDVIRYVYTKNESIYANVSFN